MDEMTEVQRGEFIKKRVHEIITAYEQHIENFATMTPQQRIDYVHGRVVNDLAVDESLERERVAQTAMRGVVWNLILILDIVSVITLVAAFIVLALVDWKDILVLTCSFIVTIITLSASRIMNYIILRQSRKLDKAAEYHINRKANTISLELFSSIVRVNRVNWFMVIFNRLRYWIKARLDGG